jgi:1-deoxy-D-xylulose-5-phosphate reductoisomerase
MASMKRIALLGSTGSIGTSCLEVVAAHADRMQVVGLAANRSWRALAEQCARFSPRRAALGDESLVGGVDSAAFPANVALQFGPDAVAELAAAEDVDVVVAAIVGAAGLRGAWAAVEAGKVLALANKETLVIAGPLVTRRAAETGATLIPVDSEHSAIFQALHAGRREDVRRIVLTASGGPFRGWSRERLRTVTPQQALAHPTWDMGAKITIDSATMTNKALEVIEARWLFDLSADQIEVVVHPQSILHSFVEFVDGSVIAQLSPPDMKLPIQYALTYPERLPGTSPTMDWTAVTTLQLEPPDLEAFPALRLGFEVARLGGSGGAVLNAANEVAVQRFLDATLDFPDVPRLCEAVLNAHDFDPDPTLSDLLRLDGWAREEARRWIS